MARRRRADQPGADRATSRAHEADYDFFIFFSFRYHHSFHGARAVPAKAILVPTAERDERARPRHLPAGVPRRARVHVQLARGARADPGAWRATESVPGVVVGIGSEIPERSNAGALPAEVRHARSLRDLRRPHRREQGLRRAVRLLRALQRVARRRHAPRADRHAACCRFPTHPRIHHLGFVERPGQVRRDGGRRAADHAVVSREPVDGGARGVGAWASRCSPTPSATCCRASAMRSNAGLFYENYAEFAETLRAHRHRRRACRRRSAATAARSSSATTRWPVIEKKYLDMLEQLSKETPSRARWSRCPAGSAPAPATLPPAREVLAGAAVGTGRERERRHGREPSDERPPMRRAAPRRRPRPQRPARSDGRAAIPAATAGRDARRASANGARRPAPRRGRRAATAAAAAAEPAATASRATSRQRQRPDSASRRRAQAIRRARPASGRDGAAAAAAAARRPQRRPPTARTARNDAARRSPGARDARLRRRHRPRSAGHPARAARRPATSRRSSSRPPIRGSRTSRVDYRDLPDASHPDNILIHHFSIGSRASRVAYALPDRMALVYHNITPPEYLRRRPQGARPALLSAAAASWRSTQTRCDLALGDSEYNRAGARGARLPAHRRAAGRARTSTTCSGPPNYMQAGAFDDDWVNVLFVGRVIPNKRIEDVIRVVPRLQDAGSIRGRGCCSSARTAASSATWRCCTSSSPTSAPPTCTSLGHVSQRGADGLLRARRRVPVRQRARGLLRAARRVVPHGRAGARLRGHGGAGHDGRRRRPVHRQGSAARRRAHRRRRRRSRSAGDRIVDGQDAALDRLEAKDFGGTLLRLRRPGAARRRGGRTRRSRSTSGIRSTQAEELEEIKAVSPVGVSWRCPRRRDRDRDSRR